MNTELTLSDIRDAARRIAGVVHRTPVLTSATIRELTGREVFFKPENLQKVGAFKARGAANAVFSLPDDVAARGVVTHSSGNHGQALAWAARARRIPAWVVMPRNAPEVKKAAVAGYGARIELCENTDAARAAATARVASETGAVLVHPFNNYMVMAGQGTAVLELLEDVPSLDMLFVPVGGGGLIAGSATAARALSPHIRIIGAEPLGANDTWRSLQTGVITPVPDRASIADGLLTTVGEMTFPIIHRLVDEVVTVTDEEIVAAMRLIWERMKLVVEPSGAVGLAAMLKLCAARPGSERVGIVLTGGNVDLDALPWARK